jgi:rRNA biogenesis protein RRP5
VQIADRAAQEVIETYERALKKFSQTPEAWTRFAQYYFGREQPTEARALLPRSLKSLPKVKRALDTFSSLSGALIESADVETISKFAQLEFRLGEAERGRTIFEGILDSYPKRLDLWNVYIDMEARVNNVQGVRYVSAGFALTRQTHIPPQISLRPPLAAQAVQ